MREKLELRIVPNDHWLLRSYGLEGLADSGWVFAFQWVNPQRCVFVLVGKRL